MVINQLSCALIFKTSTFSESAESRLFDGSSKNVEYWFLIGGFLQWIYGIIMDLHKKFPNVNNHESIFKCSNSKNKHIFWNLRSRFVWWRTLYREKSVRRSYITDKKEKKLSGFSKAMQFALKRPWIDVIHIILELVEDYW